MLLTLRIWCVNSSCKDEGVTELGPQDLQSGEPSEYTLLDPYLEGVLRGVWDRYTPTMVQYQVVVHMRYRSSTT